MYAFEDRVVRDRDELRRPRSLRSRLRLRRGRARAALAAVAAFGLGVAAPVVYHAATAPDAAATDALAARLDGTLKQMLTTGFYSPGNSYGGKFSTGTLVAAAQGAGGMVLSVQQGSGADDNALEVMLGVNPPVQEYGAIDGADFPVRCYRYVFGLYARTVQPATSIACPSARTDGSPGSVVAQYAALIATQASSPSGAPGAIATNSYPRTLGGVEALLRDEKAVSAANQITVIGTAGAGGPVFAAAVRIDGGCEFVRLDASKTAAVPFWLAPAAQQAACPATAALAESGLYGTDPAQEG